MSHEEDFNIKPTECKSSNQILIHNIETLALYLFPDPKKVTPAPIIILSTLTPPLICDEDK